MWIDSHCHLDAPEFDADRDAVVARALAAGVRMLVIPAVAAFDWDSAREQAHRYEFAYALGIHPLFVMQAGEQDLTLLAGQLERHRADSRLVAVGEIGLDFFVPGLDADRQQFFYTEQLKLARRFDLPVILHVRRSADQLLAGLGRIPVRGGIAHAFNGSAQQAQRFVDLDFKLGFGGTLTFERSLQIRRLATELPETALVLETDAPDIPPHWLYKTAEQRAAGEPRARNEPAELPRIAESLAYLRGWTPAQTESITGANACAALPKLAALHVG
ncbi:TatD family hydrolase [Roseateles oligotrophus]|uniref:TatD family hydrolase n=1 Tax=Roseateles oligotrophus TaxID=1769250 RepID=A0ABT2Y9Y0_9BURK|nr:TatD family hydrolase [Roseateles oligotrophus]MCV2367117.1 TatD family hydrolase [Roseateles oligotrophus]